MNILIIEDDPIDRKLACVVLKTSAIIACGNLVPAERRCKRWPGTDRI